MDILRVSVPIEDYGLLGDQQKLRSSAREPLPSPQSNEREELNR